MLYKEAIAESLVNAMESDPNVVCMGVGVTDPKGIFGTTLGARLRFPKRVIETPLSENMLTGACVGMAIEGWKPVLVHARNDFLMLTMEQLVNTAAKWRYMSAGRPLTFVVRSIVGRGWGQGPQHSQALHAMFAHVPGLNVVMPADADGARDALPWALAQPSPTLIIEHRRLYDSAVGKPEQRSHSRLGNPRATVAYLSASSLDMPQVEQALAAEGIKVDAFPIEHVSPLAIDDVLASAEATRALVVVDIGHSTCGVSAEVVAQAAQRVPGILVRRVTPPFVPCPASLPLENEWYPDANAIVNALHQVLGVIGEVSISKREEDESFTGPF
jgi:pyruvate dehydrogenase E1 component beta subunit